MINLLFSWGATVTLVILQFFFGNWGFFVPLAGGCVLYFATTTSWKNALMLALVVGIALDGIYARSLPLETCILAAALLFNRRWMPEVIRENGAFSAFFCGLIYFFLVEISLLLFTFEIENFWQKCYEIPIVVIVWTLGFLLVVFLFDAIARRIGAVPYCVDLTENAPHYHGGRKVSQKTIAPERGVR